MDCGAWGSARVHYLFHDPILFLVAVDWVIRKTNSLDFTFSLSHLEDLDFAADIAVISTSHTEFQEKTDALDSDAKPTGFNNITTKTQVITHQCLPDCTNHSEW